MSLASANERERRGAARLAGDRGARASIGQESAQARDRRLQGRAGQESRPDFHEPAYQDRAQDHGLDRQGIYFRQFRSCYTVCSRDFLLSVQSNRPTGCQK